MLKHLSIILLLITPICLNAQNESEATEYSFIEKNFFQEMRSEWMMGLTPSFNVDWYSYDGPYLNSFEVSTLVISLGGVGYEPRLNIYNYQDKASISLSVPVDFSLGLSITTPDDGVNTGFFALSSGLMLDANFGNHSTYNNVNRRGYAIGVGYRLHKAPLFGFRDRDYRFSRISGGFTVRFQYKDDQKNGKNKVYYFETGIPTSYTNDDTKYTANAFIIFGLGKVIGY